MARAGWTIGGTSLLERVQLVMDLARLAAHVDVVVPTRDRRSVDHLLRDGDRRAAGVPDQSGRGGPAVRGGFARPVQSTRGALRGWLYDRLLAGMTGGWYREVFGRLPEHARVLDVGIGTGGALTRCAELVRTKDIYIDGLDIDRDYLDRCVVEVARAGLADQVTLFPSSVYDHHGGTYDAIYFSASFMLLPDPVAAIKHVAAQLVPNGRIFFTQTFHHSRSPVAERVKPLLRRITTIHFGRVTYEDDFRRTLDDAGLELIEFCTMRRTRHASWRVAEARVRDDRPGRAPEPGAPNDEREPTSGQPARRDRA